MLVDTHKGQIYLESHIYRVRISRVTQNGYLIPSRVSDTSQYQKLLKNIRNSKDRGGLSLILPPKLPVFTTSGIKLNHCHFLN